MDSKKQLADENPLDPWVEEEIEQINQAKMLGEACPHYTVLNGCCVIFEEGVWIGESTQRKWCRSKFFRSCPYFREIDGSTPQGGHTLQE